MNSLLRGNALFALSAAALWGGGDFSGGMGVKRAGGGVRRGAARGAAEPHYQLCGAGCDCARARAMRFRRARCWRGGLRRAWPAGWR